MGYVDDGQRLWRATAEELTVYLGAVEVTLRGTERVTTTYYFVGGQRVAMRQGETLTYLHGDHLGSASLATDASGAGVSELRYRPYGEPRYGDAPTDRRYTGQRYDSALGLYDYQARYYMPGLGRFISADTIVPNPANPQSLNRYSYVLNNPLRYTDPSGHQNVSWEEQFRLAHGRAPDAQDRWDFDFSQQISDFSGWDATYFYRQVLYAAGITLRSSLERRWTMAEINTLFSGIESMINMLGGVDVFRRSVGNNTTIERVGILKYSAGLDPTQQEGFAYIGAEHLKGVIWVYDFPAWDANLGQWVASGRASSDSGQIIHELAHRWDYNHSYRLSKRLQIATRGSTTILGKYRSGGTPPTHLARENRKEDFAESVRYYVQGLDVDPLRANYLNSLFNTPP